MIETIAAIGLAATSSGLVTSGRYRVLHPWHPQIYAQLAGIRTNVLWVTSFVGFAIGFVFAVMVDATQLEAVILMFGGAAAGSDPADLWKCPYCQSAHYSVIGAMVLNLPLWHGLAAWMIAATLLHVNGVTDE